MLITHDMIWNDLCSFSVWILYCPLQVSVALIQKLQWMTVTQIISSTIIMNLIIFISLSLLISFSYSITCKTRFVQDLSTAFLFPTNWSSSAATSQHFLQLLLLQKSLAGIFTTRFLFRLCRVCSERLMHCSKVHVFILYSL